jgi:hypothetical protein
MFSKCLLAFKTKFLVSTSLWRACNLTPCLTGPVDYPFASRHKGPGFKSPREYLCETGILLLAMSRYKFAYKKVPAVSTATKRSDTRQFKSKHVPMKK